MTTIDENGDYASMLVNSVESNNNFIPNRISIGITPKCNSRCGYCNNWKDKSSPVPSLEILKDIIWGAKELGVKKVLFSGGEPLLYPKLFELVDYTQGLGLEYSIITNFLVCNLDLINKLSQFKCKKLGVSIDTIDPDTYKEIRGVAMGDTLKMLELLNSKGDSKIKDISLCCTVHRKNCDKLDEFLDYGLKNNFTVQFQPILIYENTDLETKNEFWPTTEQIKRLKIFFDKVVKIKNDGYNIGNKVEYLENIPIYFENSTFIPQKCYAPYAQITIDQSLNLRGCWALGSAGHISNGKDLLDLWKSEKMNNFRMKALKGKCPGCFLSCHLSKDYTKFEK